MTEKLYDKNSRLFAFSAAVTALAEENGVWRVTLDKTAFFPEGGGQAGDRGKIGGCAVFDTQIAGGEILHYTRERPAFAVGNAVNCELDAALRFARMQAHSGEHIVSGVAHTLYGAENVGFHMNGVLMTVDFDRPLSKETLETIELEANRVVYRNVPVRAWYPTPEEAAAIEYRSKLDAVENLRLVEIEGVDVCACCAPHVSFTGEIGLIKILTAVSHRGGVRITLLCGEAAYTDYALKYKNTLYCADLLKAKHNELPAALDALFEKENALRVQLAETSKKFADQVLAGLHAENGHALVFVPAATAEELCRIADGARQKTGGFCAAFAGDDCKGYSFAVALPDGFSPDGVKALLAGINGRGGGRDSMIQGKCSASEAEIRAFFAGFSAENEVIL